MISLEDVFFVKIPMLVATFGSIYCELVNVGTFNVDMHLVVKSRFRGRHGKKY